MVYSTNDRGLDLSNIEETSRDEINEFRGAVLAGRAGKLMYPLTAYSFALENRPDILKLHFRQMRTVFEIPGEGPAMWAPTMSTLHWYICNRHDEGIIHEVRACQQHGASKAQVQEMFALAFSHGGPSGMGVAYNAAFDYLQTYVEPEQPMKFPVGWEADPEAMRSGIDLTRPEMSATDRENLFGWYEKNIGEVPRSVQLLDKYNPAYLKAWRAKLEGALRGALPKQILPYTMLHYNINRGFRDGIREAALLGRSWGMTQAQVAHAVTFSTGYIAGMDALYIVDEAIGDLLDDWPTPN